MATENRKRSGQFQKGQSGNPGGRPKIPEEFKNFGKQAPERLRAIADDPATPVKVRADIEKWFAEMTYGKPSQQVDIDGKMETQGVQTIKFEGKLEEWSE